MAFHADFSQPIIVAAPDLTAPQTDLTTDPNARAADFRPSHTARHADFSQFSTAWPPALMAFQTAVITFRNVSDFFHKMTMATTMARIAITTRPIGLAFRAAFSAHWTAVQATVAAFTMAAPAA